MKYEIESTNQYDKWFIKQKDIAKATELLAELED
jgi:hypothetical protein